MIEEIDVNEHIKITISQSDYDAIHIWIAIDGDYSRVGFYITDETCDELVSKLLKVKNESK